MANYAASFIAALFATLALTPVARRLALRAGVLDCPDGKRKLQQSPMPLLGGIAVLAGWWLGIAAMFSSPSGQLPDMATGAAVSLLCICLLGVCDDIWNLPARWKLLAQMCAVLPIALSGCVVERVGLGSYSVSLGRWATPATITWLVLVINSFNLIDGMDGMASVTGAGMALLVAAIDLTQGGGAVALALIPLAGALVGFLYHNAPPAKIYLGDAGSMTIGLSVGLGSILVAKNQTIGCDLALLAAIAALPLADMTLAVLRRGLRGRSIWAADRGHIHHCLLERGWQVSQILWLLAGCSVTWGALVVAFAQPLLSPALVAAAVVLAICAVRWHIAGHTEWRLLRHWLREPGELRAVLPRNQCWTSDSFEETWQRLVRLCQHLGGSRLIVSVHQADGDWREHHWAEKNQGGGLPWAMEVSREHAGSASCRVRIESHEANRRLLARSVQWLETFAQFWAEHPEQMPAATLRFSEVAGELDSPIVQVVGRAA